jgi:hypothetical protein
MNAILNAPLAALSPKDFAAVGLDLVAYVKPVMIEGKLNYAIHAADGTPLSMTDGLAAARAQIRNHDLEPVSLH